MTTALTAIPMKMTMSASRFLSTGMTEIYSRMGRRSIDPDQCHQIFLMVFIDG